MKIGFIGTGTIASAMIEGLMSTKLNISSITISPRNEKIAADLAARYSLVHIGVSNQHVIDQSEIVFLCLRSQIAKDVLEALKFNSSHLVVSVLAMAMAQEVSQWIGQSVYRAVPLPFVGERKGLTPIYPDQPVLRTLFDALGGTLSLKDENQFNLMMTAGSLMGVYFNIIETSNQWLQKNGLDSFQASSFLSVMFGNLADETRKNSHPNYQNLESEFSTKNGTNELVSNCFRENGGNNALIQSLDTAFERIKGQ
ncbi:pyrroline-5-carboxylate reductase [Bartonella tamiae]|uniref:Pyrroline-5-carboxylate reductase catalytic N-terminal domain-containing protein n=1 Tax=Bartonella tamiae Th239 TaxID=1094558 RepID=J0QWK3_9HYPH|nr:pyrroline-5-carboxylate reductase [Bartonella tamiae]EJF90391.1 hypothetical protein ME5_00792 [Bartonella tamiae Th239]EJF93665.1 hypothetical protein MEG_01089 [Bartonella tamiae Th307]